ncbi:MAG: DUF4145 domain-containing protein [Burkholderia gladioli]
MATFAKKCPHCLKDDVVFTIRTLIPSVRQDGRADMETFATCNHCGRGVVGTITADHPSHLEQLPGDISRYPYFEVGEWLPKLPLPDIPDHLPTDVMHAFLQGESLRQQRNMIEPAGNAYRRTLEAAMKSLAPNLHGSLYERVEQLANDQKLTDAMRRFAHNIRFLGNAASHESDVADKDELADLALFTRMFLIYEFTLPAMLADKTKSTH